MFKKYYQAVEYIESLPNISKPDFMSAKSRSNFYLKRAKELMSYLNINLDQFKYIHIAGTSGKGSVVALVHEILTAAGKRVGSFYSPHPTTSIERIRVGNKPGANGLMLDKYISADDFAILMEKIKPAAKKMYISSKFGMPSYFEIFFALALLYFAKNKCQYVILETGCGGEFDATNIIKKPLITAITNIGYDHTQILGRSLEKIARTKAGIIKANSIFLSSEERQKIVKIFKEICNMKKARYQDMGDIKGIEDINSWQRIQMNNAKLAANIAKIIGVKDKDIIEGVKKTKLSCRFETIQKNPAVVLDGAHNYDKLKSTFTKLKKLKFNKLFLIFTLNENKDVSRIIKMLTDMLPKKIEFFLTRHLVAERACADLKIMYNLFPYAIKKNISLYIDPWTALKYAIKKAKRNDLILITGSFYLAGELRKNWVSEEKILKNNN